MFTLPASLTIVIHIAPGILWTLFGMAMVGIALVSTMLVYHWREYALNRAALGRAMILYFSVSIVLIAVSIVSAVGYTFSLP